MSLYFEQPERSHHFNPPVVLGDWQEKCGHRQLYKCAYKERAGRSGPRFADAELESFVAPAFPAPTRSLSEQQTGVVILAR